MKNIIIELTVRNHPGVMSHIAGLFSRKVYNIEGILCTKLKNNEQSRIYLMVENNERLELMIKRAKKLEDVLDASIHNGSAQSMFDQLYDLCN